VRFATFTREKDQLILIMFGLENQTLDDVYRTATDLATHWELLQPPLDAWRKRAKDKAGQFVAGGTARRGMTPSIDLEIVDSFDAAKPYAINFQLSWIEHLSGPRGKGTWDLSKTHLISQVREDPTKPNGCLFNPSGVVTVRFSQDLEFHHFADWVGFHGKRDEISHVQFNLQTQTAEDAHLTALELATRFKLPQAPINQWYAQVAAGKPTLLESVAGTGEFPAFLNIGWGAHDKPYRIGLIVAWPEHTPTQPAVPSK
jgi:hypothetical protein